jgi:hypothetical protein
MSADQMAEMGQKDAQRLVQAIQSSLELVDQLKGSRVHWWGGFLACLAGMCHADVGPEAHDILMAVTTEALKQHASKNTTGRRVQ